MPSLSREELESEVRRLAPFHHDIELPHGVRTLVPELVRRDVERTRVANLVRHLWPSLLEACGGTLQGKSVLDVACNCGGFSVEAARAGASRVLGVDVVDRYLDQARFVRDALGLGQVDFRKTAVEDLSPEAVGTFDVAFCFGILYHLENPVLGMRRLAGVTSKVLVVDTDLVVQRFSRKAYWLMSVQAPSEAGAENATTALWREKKIVEFSPTAPAVVRLMKFLGFEDVVHVRPSARGLEKRYYKGTRGTFVGVRRGAAPSAPR